MVLGAGELMQDKGSHTSTACRTDKHKDGVCTRISVQSLPLLPVKSKFCVTKFLLLVNIYP